MDGYLADGRRNLISFYGKTQREVKAKANEYHRLHTFGLDTSVKHTFATWADFWFENHKDNITVTTQENYKYVLAAHSLTSSAAFAFWVLSRSIALIHLRSFFLMC